MRNWLKHAFAIESPDAVAPSASQSQAIELVCREIVRRNMVLPAQMLLESTAPMHYLGGQLLRFVEPFLGILLEPAAIRDFAAFLERPGAVQYICGRFDEMQWTGIESPTNANGGNDCHSAEAVGPSSGYCVQGQLANNPAACNVEVQVTGKNS